MERDDSAWIRELRADPDRTLLATAASHELLLESLQREVRMLRRDNDNLRWALVMAVRRWREECERSRALLE
jgi:hypothetical protein